DGRVVQQGPVVGLGARYAELLGHPSGYLSVHVRDRGHLHARIALPSGNVGVLRPAARSDYRNAKLFSAHGGGTLPLLGLRRARCSPECRSVFSRLSTTLPL